MSPNMKFSLLALVGAASAIPHYGGHSKFHSKGAGYAGPTGGWSNTNQTEPRPTGTGTGVVPVSEKTTTIDGTLTSTETIYSTIYMTKSTPPAGGSGASSVGVAGASSGAGASGSGAACGPATVYVTATNKVTVTVPAGGAASSAYTPSGVATPDVPEGASSSSAASKSTKYIYVSPSPVVSSSSAVEHGATPSSSSAPPVPIPEQSNTYQPPVVSPTPPSSSAVAPPSSVVVPPSSVVVPPSSVVVPPSSVAAPPSSVVAPPSSTAHSSAAAPSSSGSPGYSGGKRGLVYRWDGASAAKSFAGGKFGFAWNWEAETKGDIGDLNFIPTLRTLADAGAWPEKVEAAISSGSKVVFGINEPDILAQANLEVGPACDAWIKYMNPIKEKHPDVIVAGPAVSSTDKPGKGIDWLRQFVSTCTNAKFDVLNLHWYGPATAGVDAFSTYIDNATKEFGKNVWVTEFGLYPGESAANAKSFLENALTYLDGNNKCDGYSYYAVGTFDPASNLLGTAEALSDTGKVYVA